MNSSHSINMHVLGNYAGTQRSLNGDLIVAFAIDDNPANLEQASKLADKQLVIDVKKYYEKRSDKANAYCWEICTLMAEALGSDKDTIYLMKIKQYGQYEDFDIPQEQISFWKHIKDDKGERLFRAVEPQYYFTSTITNAEGIERQLDMANVRCYRGSHTYNSKEMNVFLNGLVQDAKEIGVETRTPDEIAAAIALWKSRG